MSLKQEIETWVQALSHYDNNEFDEALKSFDGIADTSRILFNCGVIHATLGEHEKAVECYQRAVALDRYLAVAYFQQGVSNFLIGDFEEALANFNDTLLYLRGNTLIDYDQLGLKFRLYSCEVLFNRGLCYLYLQQTGPGMQDLEYAVKEKVTPDHDVIDEAIRERAEGYTVFSIPVGVVYRPNDAKVKNLKTKDYLGKARLVAASDRNNAFLGFQGSEMKRMNGGDSSKDDRPMEGISYAATNLVQKNLSSRTRQQSEPPINRNMFPPTPPPESDKSQPYSGGNGSVGSISGRSASTRRPPRLDLEGTQTSGPKDTMGGQSGPGMPQMERLRIGTTRTASEPRGPSRTYSNNMRNRNGNNSRQQPQLYRETTNSRRQMGGDSGFAPVSEDGYPEDVYDMYGSPISPKNTRGMASMGSRRQQQRQPKYVPEDDYNSDIYEDDSADEAEFEMVGSRPPPRRRGTSRRPEIRKIRVKAHAGDDTRYIMIGPAVEFGDFEGRIRDKFGFRGRLKIKMQDDGDMITMGDQDDLEMLISSAKQLARKERNEMGKMEIWIQEQI
ncbi:hypothetical protein FQN54_002886 [Arachnomyces sp. PD_36]|nr:hypothetical protein FQN54_002886 [Arachnomyces sp. PD_36]